MSSSVDSDSKHFSFWREFVVKAVSIILNSRIAWPLDVTKQKGSKWVCGCLKKFV